MNLKSTLLTLSLIASTSTFAGIEVLLYDDLQCSTHDQTVEALKNILADSSVIARSIGYQNGTASMESVEIFIDTLEDNIKESCDLISTPKVAIYKLDNNNKIIGGMLYYTMPVANIGIISINAIHKDYRNKGYEEALIKHALNEFKQAGCDWATISIVDDQTPYTQFLINLHKQMGFALVEGDPLGETLYDDQHNLINVKNLFFCMSTTGNTTKLLALKGIPVR